MPPLYFGVKELEDELDALRKDTIAVVREQNAIYRSMAGVMSDKARNLKRVLVVQAFLVIQFPQA